MKKSKVIISLLVILLCCLIFLGMVYYLVPKIHKAGITSSIKEWGEQYSVIHNMDDVVVAISMLDYIENYYSNYDSDGDVNGDNLKKQRAETLQVIIKSLEDYTDEKFGNDTKKWEEWSRQKGRPLIGDWFYEKTEEKALTQ